MVVNDSHSKSRSWSLYQPQRGTRCSQLASEKVWEHHQGSLSFASSLFSEVSLLLSGHLSQEAGSLAAWVLV